MEIWSNLVCEKIFIISTPQLTRKHLLQADMLKPRDFRPMLLLDLDYKAWHGLPIVWYKFGIFINFYSFLFAELDLFSKTVFNFFSASLLLFKFNVLIWYALFYRYKSPPPSHKIVYNFIYHRSYLQYMDVNCFS